MMRPSPSFSPSVSPSVWGNHFLSCVPTFKNGGSHDHQHLQSMKEKVRSVLQSYVGKSSSQKLNMIDSIHHLGVSYHFESEIAEILQDMHKSAHYNDNNDKDVDDLYTVSLWFRLLRQQGFNVSCDIFEKFRENKSNFKVALIHDVLGLLSLYEAAYFRTHGEDILDQALEFTTIHLKSSLSDLNPNLREKVMHALNCPLLKGVPRVEARYYISMYSREVSQNDLLLQFATLDFNTLQAQHQKELKHLAEWWKKLDFVTAVPYARKRITEGYFWPLGMYFEPQYAMGRRILGKLLAMISAIDDTYDAYATIEELEPFTEAIQRWNISPIDSLPNCMKVVFQALLDLFNEMELLTAEDGRSCFVQFAKREIQKLAQAYLVEAKWGKSGQIPSYDEYMKNGITTSTYPAVAAAAFLGLGHIATREVFEWISTNELPKIIRALSIFGRLGNDLGSHKFERKREHVASAVECCMKQYGISEEEAYKLLNEEIENAWKDINEECLSLNSIPMPVLECVVNISRVNELIYAHFQDRYTHWELLNDHVAAVLVDRIEIEQYT